MKAYLLYTSIVEKEIEIPDKFAPLSTTDDWSNELWKELDEYVESREFYEQTKDIDGDLCAIEDTDGNTLCEW